MRRLSKRWEPMIHISTGGKHRTFLSEVATKDNPEPLSWGCIETYGSELAGPYKLEIWDNDEYAREWEFIQDFDTLKEAKEVGRLLAGVAMSKNF